MQRTRVRFTPGALAGWSSGSLRGSYPRGRWFESISRNLNLFSPVAQRRRQLSYKQSIDGSSPSGTTESSKLVNNRDQSAECAGFARDLAKVEDQVRFLTWTLTIFWRETYRSNRWLKNDFQFDWQMEVHKCSIPPENLHRGLSRNVN